MDNEHSDKWKVYPKKDLMQRIEEMEARIEAQDARIKALEDIITGDPDSDFTIEPDGPA